MNKRARTPKKARRTRDPDDTIEGCSDQIGGVNHPVELGRIDHVSSESWNPGVTRELQKP